MSKVLIAWHCASLVCWHKIWHDFAKQCTNMHQLYSTCLTKSQHFPGRCAFTHRGFASISSVCKAKHHKSLAGPHRSQWSQWSQFVVSFFTTLKYSFKGFMIWIQNLDLYIQSGSQRKCTMVDDHSKLQSISIVYVTWNVEPKPSNQGTNLANMKKLAMLAMLL